MKKVALIGLGAMGSFFAGKLRENLGDDFVVIAEGERKERIEKNGLTINGKHYSFKVVEPSSTDFEADLVIVAVKNPVLDLALESIRNFVGEKTQIMAVLNGVEADERAMEVYGEDHVVYTYMRVGSQVKNGHAVFDEAFGKVVFGEKDNTDLSPRVEKINQLFDQCHIQYFNDTDMIRSLWHKFMSNVGGNLTCALLGIPFGGFTCSDHMNEVRKMLMKEVVDIAKAKGIGLEYEDIEMKREIYKRIPFNNQPSTLQDLNAKVKTEIDMFAGTVIRLGKEENVPTPANEMVYHAIRALEEKNEGLFKR